MVKEYRGRVSTWKEDRGFGFIQPQDGGAEVFFHISDIAQGRGKIATNILATYRVTKGNDGRLRATHVSLGSESLLGLFVGSLFVIGFLAPLLLLATSKEMNVVGAIVFGIYLIMSVVTFFSYWADKRQAKINAQRTPESVLHLFELLGGWPGGLIAQYAIRHKNRKTSYQMVFWIIVLIHISLLGGAYLLWW